MTAITPYQSNQELTLHPVKNDQFDIFINMITESKGCGVFFTLFSKSIDFFILESKSLSDRTIAFLDNTSQSFKAASKILIFFKIKTVAAKLFSLEKDKIELFELSEKEAVIKNVLDIAKNTFTLVSDLMVLTHFGMVCKLYQIGENYKKLLDASALSFAAFSSLIEIYQNVSKCLKFFEQEPANQTSFEVKTFFEEQKIYEFLEAARNFISFTVSLIAINNSYLAFFVVPQGFVLGLSLILIYLTFYNVYYQNSMSYSLS